MSNNVIILRGVSGTGKSTYTRNNYLNTVVCSADDYFMRNGEYKFNPRELGEAHGACLRKFTDALLENKNWSDTTIVVDNTNTSIAEIAPYAALALAYGYDLQIITLLVDPFKAWSRNVHGVTLEGVKRQRTNLDAGTNELRAYERRWPHTIVEL